MSAFVVGFCWIFVCVAGFVCCCFWFDLLVFIVLFCIVGLCMLF